MPLDFIIVRAVHQHKLKNTDVLIHQDKLVIITHVMRIPIHEIEQFTPYPQQEGPCRLTLGLPRVTLSTLILGTSNLISDRPTLSSPSLSLF